MSDIATLTTLLKKTKGPARQAVLVKIRAATKAQRQEEGETALRSHIVTCRSCGLNRTRTRAVPWDGPAWGKADLIIAGEAPGADEDSKGRPFVGKSGMLLNRMLKAAGTTREKVMVVNTLCCRPPNNRDPKPRELEACRPNFHAQLEISECAVGVTLGAYALAAIMGKPRTSLSMAENLDKPVWVDGRIWIPTYHPAYALRNRYEVDTIENSIKMALALRWGKQVLPYPAHDQVDFEGKPGIDYLPQLEKFGWVLLHSKLLNCQIVMVKDEDTVTSGTVAHLPRYTFDELVKVGVAGKGRTAGWTKQALRTLHMVRAEFDGTVVIG